MKISKLFHWLYCAVMFLPLFCLPVYALAVRSDNNYQPITLDIDTANYYQSNDVIADDVTSLTFGNVYRWNDDFVTQTSLAGTIMLNIEPNYILIDRFNITVDFDEAVLLINSQGRAFIDIKNNNAYVYSISAFNQVFDFVLKSYNVGGIDYALPHISKTSSIYFKDYSTITYNDTDFGSQTIYTLYKEVDDYFNYDDVLSIGELYDWCNINLFNGNATLGFFIFFHLLEYWLLTTLLWLIFDILMYVPQLCHRWLDKASLE